MANANAEGDAEPMSDPHVSLDAVLAPLNRARGLPSPFYVDPRMAEAERRRVFFGEWAGIGFGKDIPAVGEAMPIDFRVRRCLRCGPKTACGCSKMSAGTAA